MLSPACPSSNNFRNISTPVTTVFCAASCIPTIATSSPTFPTPPSPPPPPPLPPPPPPQISSIRLQHRFSPRPHRPRLYAPPPPPHPRLHHQDGAVHLRRPRDHVLDVVRVPRTVDVRVVPLLRLVLHVRHRDRDPPLPLLRRIVDRPVLPHRDLRVLRVQHLRDRRRQRRLPVIDVPDRPHVHVRLRPLVLRLRHPSSSSVRGPAGEHGAHDRT